MAVEGRAGEGAYLLKLVPAQGDAVTLTVSARSGLLLERETAGTTEIYSDYRTVDGERIPFRTLIHDGLGETSIVVERARFNVRIAKRTFTPAK
jgi:hypothetical protein